MSIITLYLLFAMLAVVWFDITRYRIPNWLVGSLIAIYPIAVYLALNNVDWVMGLSAACAMFVIGYGLFMMKWVGAGDIKLLVVCALWMGWDHALEFVFAVALLGGAFALLLWVGRKLIPHIPRKSVASLPRILREGEPVPYGVAIAGAFLLMIWTSKIPALF